MRLFVTGASGFIGSRLVERLRERGDEVACLIRPTSRRDLLEKLGAELVEGDLGAAGIPERALEGVDAVLHLAGVVRAWRAEEYFAVHVGGTKMLAECAVRSGVRRFVLMSSLAAAGPSPDGRPLTEGCEPRPMTPYGESKLAAERVLAEFGDRLGTAVVRPCIVYGPRDRDVLALFRLARWPVVPYAAPPGATLSLVHVDDVVDLTLAVLERAPPGSLYFASDGTPRSWPDFVRSVAAALGRRAVPLRVPPALLYPAAWCIFVLKPFLRRPPLLSPSKVREAAQRAWVCSPERARRELGWLPRVDLEDGLRRTAEWYRRSGWL